MPSPEGRGRGRHWAKLSERGSRWGLHFIVRSHRLLGRRITRLLLFPLVGYFLLRAGRAREASFQYLRQLNTYTNKHPPEPKWTDIFKHMLAFAQSLLDKMSAWLGDVQKMPIEFHDVKACEALMLSGKGALLIGSHLGNLELARALVIYNKHAKVNAVIYTNSPRFNAVLSKLHADFDINFIQVSDFGPQTAIQLKEKIDKGELVVIAGDRTPPLNEASKRICRVNFLGKPAPFAQGPWVLASLLDCPVYLFFCLCEGGRHKLYMEHFADTIKLQRDKRIENIHAYLQQYASRLEHYCLKAPMQWFNFYDFWAEPEQKAGTTGGGS